MAAVRVVDERHDLKRVVDPRLKLQTGKCSNVQRLRSSATGGLSAIEPRFQECDVFRVAGRRPIRAGDLLEVQQVVF